MKALGETILLIIVIQACDISSPKTERDVHTPVEDSSIENDPKAGTTLYDKLVSQESPFHEFHCNNITATIHYQYTDSTVDPYEPSRFSLHIVDRASDKIVAEYIDSSMVGFEYIHFDSSNLNCHRCLGQVFEFMIWYNVQNDDKIEERLLSFSESSLSVFTVKWTPDGIYKHLDKSIYAELDQHFAPKSQMLTCIQAHLYDKDQELNPQNKGYGSGGRKG